MKQCKVDNKNRLHPVPDEVLDKQIMRFQVPFYEEGWTRIIIPYLGIDYPPNLLPTMEGFDQKTLIIPWIYIIIVYILQSYLIEDMTIHFVL